MTVVRPDYFAPGDYNAICDGCGAKLKASALAKDWKGFYKCVRCWEPRQPQDFVRSRNGPEPTPVAFVREPPAFTFTGLCSPNGRSSLPDAAAADCWIADFIDPSFDPDVT